MGKIGIGYCRVSSESQEENTSLEEQDRKIRAFAESQGIELAAMFQDVSSGGNTDRSGYQDALNYLAKHKADCFLVAKFDRAHRHQENLLVFERELREKDVAFLSVAELLDSSTPTGRLMFQILGSFAEFERNIINERTKGGRKAKLAKQACAGGRPPFGFSKDWQVVEREVRLVQEMFSGYLACGSLGKLQSRLRRLGEQFSRQALHLILTNRAYLGEYHYDGEQERNRVVVAKHHQAVVSPVIFGRVQNALGRRNKRTVGRK